MLDRQQIPIEKLIPDPDQPRKHFDEGDLLALGNNMLAHGQLVPLIAYMAPGSTHYTLLDGERRWRAAQLVGIKQLNVILLSERPTPLSLHVLQMSLEAHKVGLSLMERSNFLSIIKEENKWSVNEVAANVNMKQPLVSKLLGFQKLCSEVQQLLHEGTLDIEKAYAISQEADPSRQRTLAEQAMTLSREQLRRTVHGVSTSPEPTTDVATFALPGDRCVVVRGEGLMLTVVIDVLQETLTNLRKGRKKSLDLATLERVMRDMAKIGKHGV